MTLPPIKPGEGISADPESVPVDTVRACAGRSLRLHTA